VCPSNKREICDKTKYSSAQIIIPHKRKFILVFKTRRMVGAVTPSTWNFGSNWPCWSENANLQSIFAHSTSAVTCSKKVQLTLIGSPLHAFRWAYDEHCTLPLSGSKTQNGHFPSKIALRWKKVCYSFFEVDRRNASTALQCGKMRQKAMECGDLINPIWPLLDS